MPQVVILRKLHGNHTLELADTLIDSETLAHKPKLLSPVQFHDSGAHVARDETKQWPRAVSNNWAIPKRYKSSGINTVIGQ